MINNFKNTNAKQWFGEIAGFLLNSSPVHRLILAQNRRFVLRIQHFAKLPTEIDEMRNELIEIDKVEEIQKVKHDDTLVIHLFPIGYFEFPKNQIEKVFEVLEIEDENLKSHFKYLFEFVIPAVNIYTAKIENEGLLNGILEYKGIGSYRNV
ncbi:MULTISPECIES: hypothetical protein [Flavobacterium]|uniref:hypothetical protein n=1 Tax=Flavobacterium TaxID=237 RepID=UPI0027B9F846|nr:hypothetical protein [Flavobacterium lindanitolerans]